MRLRSWHLSINHWRLLGCPRLSIVRTGRMIEFRYKRCGLTVMW